MPPKRSRAHPRSREASFASKNQDLITRVPFRVVVAGQNNSGFSSGYGLYATALGDAVQSISANFELYRLEELKVSIKAAGIPSTLDDSGTFKSTDNMCFIGYLAIDHTELKSTPSFNSVSQLPHFAMDMLRASFRVKKSELGRVPLKWYHVESTGDESDAFQSPGTVYWGTKVNTAVLAGYVVYLTLEGVVAFTQRTENTVSLMVKQMAEHRQEVRAEEEQALMGVKTWGARMDELQRELSALQAAKDQNVSAFSDSDSAVVVRSLACPTPAPVARRV